MANTTDLGMEKPVKGQINWDVNEHARLDLLDEAVGIKGTGNPDDTGLGIVPKFIGQRFYDDTPGLEKFYVATTLLATGWKEMNALELLVAFKKSQIMEKSFSQKWITVTPPTGSITLDLDLGNFFDLGILTGNVNFLEPTGTVWTAADGATTIVVRMQQPVAGGPLTVDWNPGSDFFRSPNGFKLEASIGSSEIDYFTFIKEPGANSFFVGGVMNDVRAMI